MADDQGQEKTELPTPKRLNDARQKGQVPRSVEFTTVLVLIASAALMLVLGERIIESLAQVMLQGFTFERKDLFNPVMMMHSFLNALEIIALDLGSFLAVTVIAAIVAPASIGGWNFSTQAFAPKLNKINPLNGLKRIFGPQGLIELTKALAKFIVIGVISVLVIWSLRDRFLTLGTQDVNVAMVALGELVLWIFFTISASLILIALVDVPFQRWNHTRQLKMTKQEVKDESKDTEGNPEIKGRVRKVQFEMSQQRMMQNVPDADVIITNPTHYAVALKYDQAGAGAPTLVAKGTDLIAQQIRTVAEANEVPVISAPPLTRAVYFSTEIGDEIPSGLYFAIAQVLAFVFQMRRYKRQGGAKPQLNLEDLTIPDELKRD
jgi:flagellar biosynthetic protein FlhB